MSLPVLDHPAASTARRLLRAGLTRLKRFGPRSLNVSDAVAQVFVNTSDLMTHYTFVNFPSLYAPDVAREVHYQLVLYDSKGRRAGKWTIEVPAFGSVAVSPTELSPSVPQLGLLTAQIRSSRPLYYQDRHLGRLTAHFYALYHDASMSALSVIHPQTMLWRADPPLPESWNSNMLIPSDHVARIEAFQANPTARARRTVLSLRTMDGSTLASSEAVMPARSVRRVVWDSTAAQGHELVSLGSDSLTAPNAKPLVFLWFGGGAFSAAHS